ncbi:class A beta-lactamase [Acetobacteraceae bacterium KSS8]|uniref:Beta-lactamase n=1 Tax=Endosaccharibacter trunci TaxID=2812733 RepID=A0ABT1WD65_9PROT|nr:class A beta-lactamase [Acetobacteraceae bacterium KSS8]
MLGETTASLTRRGAMLGTLGIALAPPAWAQSAVAPEIGAVRDYERRSGGHVGFWATNVTTGRQIGWRADERFVMCSTFKMSLVALVLRNVDRGAERLDAVIRFTKADVPDWYAPVARANLARGEMTVGEMCRAAIEQSDNSCATLLLTRSGGPAAVTRFWRGLGDMTSRLDDGEPMVNRTKLGGLANTTTPHAMATTLGRIVLGDVLTPSSREMLRGWLVACTTGLNRLRAGLPAGWTAGDKTGNNGADAAGDILVAWPPNGSGPVLIAAYTRGGQPTPDMFSPLFAAIAREAAGRLG